MQVVHRQSRARMSEWAIHFDVSDGRRISSCAINFECNRSALESNRVRFSRPLKAMAFCCHIHLGAGCSIPLCYNLLLIIVLLLFMHMCICYDCGNGELIEKQARKQTSEANKLNRKRSPLKCSGARFKFALQTLPLAAWVACVGVSVCRCVGV